MGRVSSSSITRILMPVQDLFSLKIFINAISSICSTFTLFSILLSLRFLFNVENSVCTFRQFVMECFDLTFCTKLLLTCKIGNIITQNLCQSVISFLMRNENSFLIKTIFLLKMFFLFFIYNCLKFQVQEIIHSFSMTTLGIFNFPNIQQRLCDPTFSILCMIIEMFIVSFIFACQTKLNKTILKGFLKIEISYYRIVRGGEFSNRQSTKCLIEY